MPELSLTKGTDTTVMSASPTTKYGSGKYPAARSGQARILLGMPLAIPAGVVILSATLSVRVRHDHPAQTWTVQALDGKWSERGATWNNQPGVVSGASTTAAVGALSGGSRFEVDMTELVQLIADGQPNYGWRISTNNSGGMRRVFGFDSGASAWRLDVEYSDPWRQPENLSPEGVVSVDKWVCSFDDIDDLAMIRVQVDAAADAGSPDFDSDWITATTPQVDLAATAFTGLADGASTYWRASVRTTTNAWSAWSDWAQVTRHVKPDLVLNSPSSTVLPSATATIDAELDPPNTTDALWRVTIHDLGDAGAIRYNSGYVAGETYEAALPLKWNGKLVFPDAGTYRLTVRAYDRLDRVASAGDPTYVEEVRDVTVGHDAEADVPAMVWAFQEGKTPAVRLRWTAVADPDYFVVARNGVPVAVVDPDDSRVAPGAFEFVDVEAPPNTTTEWSVLAWSGSDWSDYSAPESATTVVEGDWILSRFGQVCIDGGSTGDLTKSDKRTSYDLPYSPNVVDIVTAVGGYSGGYKGEINPDYVNVPETLAIIEQIRQNPQFPVVVAWGTASCWAYLASLSAHAHPDMMYDKLIHEVSWEDMNETTDSDDDVAAGMF